MLSSLKHNFIQGWVDKKEEQLFVYGNEKLSEIGIFFRDGLVLLIPDVVGISALLIGGWIMINPLISENPLVKPLGLLGAIFTVGTSIIIASKGASI